MKAIDICLRLLLAIWGIFELLGYLWGGGLPSSANDVYRAAPTIALLFGALLPNQFLARLAGVVVFTPLALLAIVRSAHQFQIALALPSGGDPGAAASQATTVVLIVLVLAKMVYLYRNRMRGDASSSGNTSVSGA